MLPVYKQLEIPPQIDWVIGPAQEYFPHGPWPYDTRSVQ